MNSVKRITLLAAMVPYASYGILGIDCVRYLEALEGLHVSIRPIQQSETFAKIPDDIRAKFVNGPQPEPWEILMNPPSVCPTPGKRTLFFTMHETTRLPAMSAYYLNKATVVCVPSQFNAATFSACGVNVPIRVVPLGIDTSLYHYRGPHLGTDFVFGAAGRMKHGGVRKGLNDVIRVFLKTFPAKQCPNIKLKVKCFPDCEIPASKDSRIEIMPAHISDQQLSDWFASLDVFVSAARGEGWGLMQHQAMAIGRPVISTRFGGLADFFEEDFGIVVPHRLEPAQFMYEGQGHWPEFRDEDLGMAMHMATTNRPAMIEAGARASAKVTKLTKEASAEKLVAVLKEFGAL